MGELGVVGRLTLLLQELLDKHHSKINTLRGSLKILNKSITEVDVKLKKISAKDSAKIKVFSDRFNALKLKAKCIADDLNGRLEIDEIISNEMNKIIEYMVKNDEIVINAHIVISAISDQMKFDPNITYLLEEIATMIEYLNWWGLKKSVYCSGKIHKISINGKNPSYYTGLKLIRLKMKNKTPLNIIRLIRNTLNLDDTHDIEYLIQATLMEGLIQKGMSLWGRETVNETFLNESRMQRNEHPIKALNIFNSLSNTIKKKYRKL